jgi:hypothetical protein
MPLLKEPAAAQAEPVAPEPVLQERAQEVPKELVR